MDGGNNVFANSLQMLGQYMMNAGPGNAAAGTGQGNTNAANPNPVKINTTWDYGPNGIPAAAPPRQVASTQNQVQVPINQFAPPQSAGAQGIKNPFSGQSGGGGGGGGGIQPKPIWGQGGGGGTMDLGSVDSGGGDLSGLGSGAYSGGGGATVGDVTGGGGGAGGAAGGAALTAGGDALAGISNALGKAGQAIGSVNTMPSIVQGGPIPGINQWVPQLIGARQNYV